MAFPNLCCVSSSVISLTAWEAWRRFFRNDCPGAGGNTPETAFKRTALQPEKPIYPKMENGETKIDPHQIFLFVKNFGVYLFLWFGGARVLPTWDFC